MSRAAYLARLERERLVRAEQQGRARRAAREQGPAFAEVRLTASPEALLEVVCDTPRRILVHTGFDAETLARVVAALEGGGAPGACPC